MAKKEKKIGEELPAYIDYESSSDDIDVERWNANNFEDYWRVSLVKKRKIAAHPWSLKTKAIAKRMIKEFGLEDLKRMINWWTEYSAMENAPVFEHFYTKRYTVYDKAKRKDYTEWEFE